MYLINGKLVPDTGKPAEGLVGQLNARPRSHVITNIFIIAVKIYFHLRNYVFSQKLLIRPLCFRLMSRLRSM